MIKLAQLGILITLIVYSALVVLMNAHDTRQMHNTIFQLQQVSQRLKIVEGQLLIERTSLVTPARVERRAHDELQMFVPNVEDIRVVTP